VESLVVNIPVKFEEINLKFKKFEKVKDVIKFEKVRKSARPPIHIQSQLLSEDTQYSQY